MLKMVQSNFNIDSFFSLNTKTVRSYYCNLSRWKFLRCVFPKAPKKTWSCVATVFGPFFLSTCAHMLKEKAKFNLRSFFAWTFGSSALFFLTSHSGTNKVQSNIWNQKQARSTLSFKKSFFFKVEVQNIWNRPKASPAPRRRRWPVLVQQRSRSLWPQQAGDSGRDGKKIQHWKFL